MGEEKPDEELMGKRKSSPRLSTASFEADDCIFTELQLIIPAAEKICPYMEKFHPGRRRMPSPIVAIAAEPYASFKKQLCGTIGG
ncbi:hypothetical protein ET464_03345 [Paenibacillus protaetiae]|uniref:Uncharacterized protein n=1 Tax=Paenibacillus protaetiae TaxID=2509456 RepID=A0A4P6EV75_9BACL|nr:hypothetical protein ET464_03345 [Paenibacillus protaetiae]